MKKKNRFPIYLLYRYCEKRRKTMLNHVHEGYEQNLWTHIDQ